MKKKILLIIFCFLLSATVFSQKTNLKFANGKFKIIQLTDLHWVGSDFYKAQNDSTFSLIRQMIHIEHPGLVVLTGDVIVSANASEGWKSLISLFEEEKTFFAVTFGNHDCESDLSKTKVLELLEKSPYNFTHNAKDEDLSGSGNCSIPVFSSDEKSKEWILYLFDSHNIISDRSFGYYDWIKHDQIEWYRKESSRLELENKKKLPSLAFFHIPLPEYETARWVCREFGEKREGVCSPSLNSGLFYAFIERKDVIGTFAGHDHNNDYMVDLNGNIALAYGRKTGYPAAYDEVLNRGIRVITLHENEAAFDTYIRDLKGTYSKYMFEQKNRGTGIPRFSGSFIQEYLVRDWTNQRWDQEMNMLKEAGMEYLIYAPSLFTDTSGISHSVYPSKLTKKTMQGNSIEKCLQSAQKYGIRVFIGLNFNDRWWKVDYDASWLINQMEIGNKIADELVTLYKDKYKDTLYGWYWTWEVDNLNCMTSERQSILAVALNTNLDHLSKITPDMPFMMSPFMNEKVGGNADEYRKMWENVFSKTHFRSGDIFAPQDCIGAGGLTLDHLEEWFSKLKQAVNTKPGLKFWGNVETFDQQFWVSAPLTRIVKQLEIVNGYVNNIICFAYSHYNSPYVVSKDYHNCYVQYSAKGELPEMEIPHKILNATLSHTSAGIEIKWISSSMAAIDGYNIYRDGALIKKLQLLNGNYPFYFTDKEGSLSSIYEISAYNVLGKESSKYKIEPIK